MKYLKRCSQVRYKLCDRVDMRVDNQVDDMVLDQVYDGMVWAIERIDDMAILIEDPDLGLV